MQAGGVAHLDDDVRGHGADALEHIAGQARLVACDHDDRHSLADGAADAEDNACEHAGFRRREHDREDRALVTRAHGDRALIVGGRYRAQRGLGDADDGRQDHDAEQHGRGEDGRAGDVRTEQRGDGADTRHDDDHAEKAVDDGGDAGEQLGAGLEQAVELFRAVERHEDGGQQADRHADDDRACGDVDAAEDHRQNAVNVVARLPLRAREEVQQADLLHGRNAVGEQKQADQHDRGD